MREIDDWDYKWNNGLRVREDGNLSLAKSRLCIVLAICNMNLLSTESYQYLPRRHCPREDEVAVLELFGLALPHN